MPALLARIGIYVIVAAIALDTGLHYFGKFEYHFPFYGTFSVFLVPLGFLLILAAVVAKLNARVGAAGAPFFPSVAGPSGASEPEPQIVGTEKPELLRRPLWSPLTMWVGIFMLLLVPTSYLGGYYWWSTRTFNPLDIPLTLTSGRMSTPEFYINVSEVEMGVGAPCWSEDVRSIPRVQFTALQNGKQVGRWEVPQNYSVYFRPKKNGNYSLNVQFLSEAACLKDPSASVVVRADSTYYDEVYTFLQWLALALIGPGLVVLGRSVIGSKAARFEVSATAYPHGIRPRRWPLRPRFTSLPSRGLLSFWLAVPLIIAMWAHVAGSAIGFRVHLLPVSQTSKAEPATGTLTLRIDARKRYYLNSKLISQEELTNTIARLAWPAPPVVYLYADPNLDYKDVIAAIDTLRGLRANVVLLTRQPRSSSQ